MLKSEVRELLCEVFGDEVAVFCMTKFDPSADGHLPRFMEPDAEDSDWKVRMMAYGAPDYVGRAVFSTEDSELMDGCTFWLRATDSGFELMYTGDEDDMYVSQPDFYGGSYDEAVSWVGEMATAIHG